MISKINLIDKILFEGIYAFGDSVYDQDYFVNVSPRQIKQKAEKVAQIFGIKTVKQTKSGSCYFVLFNPKNHFIYEVRVSDHTSNKKSDYYQVIELSYSQSIYDMVKTIKKKIGIRLISEIIVESKLIQIKNICNLKI